jgi:tetratricopeptide (TPR) repeat protein
MPFVRVRGNQLAILHGTRTADSGAVDQKTLFTFYSRAEAEAAVGPRRFELEQILAERHPQVRFDWDKLWKAVGEQLDALPDAYDYGDRSARRFEAGLHTFARELLVADPRTQPQAGALLQARRHELELVAWLIQWRLQTAAEADDLQGRDEFHWRFEAPADGVPPDAEEHAVGLYERGRLTEADRAFRLFVACFPSYAEGHNYLGLIALEQGRLDDAVAEFRTTAEKGRRLFPKRIPKDDWWSDHATRPYMRGLRNLALTLNRLGRHEEALAVCDTLEQECHDDLTVDAFRASIFLNTGRYAEAGDRALRLVEIWPTELFVAGFALAELRDPRAPALMVRAVLHHPRAAQALLGLRVPKPTFREEHEDDEAGRELRLNLAEWLRGRRRRGLVLLRAVWDTPAVRAAVTEIQTALLAWRQNDRGARARMEALRSAAHADALARTVGGGDEARG